MKTALELKVNWSSNNKYDIRFNKREYAIPPRNKYPRDLVEEWRLVEIERTYAAAQTTFSSLTLKIRESQPPLISPEHYGSVSIVPDTVTGRIYIHDQPPTEDGDVSRRRLFTAVQRVTGSSFGFLSIEAAAVAQYGIAAGIAFGLGSVAVGGLALSRGIRTADDEKGSPSHDLIVFESKSGNKSEVVDEIRKKLHNSTFPDSTWAAIQLCVIEISETEAQITRLKEELDFFDSLKNASAQLEANSLLAQLEQLQQQRRELIQRIKQT